MDTLPKQTFARLYLDERRLTAEVRRPDRVSRQTLTRPAREYGIPLRDDSRDHDRRGTVERDLTVERYVEAGPAR